MQKVNIFQVNDQPTRRAEGYECTEIKLSDNTQFVSMVLHPQQSIVIKSRGCVVNMFNGNVKFSPEDKITSSELLMLDNEESVQLMNNNDYQVFFNITGNFHYG